MGDWINIGAIKKNQHRFVWRKWYIVGVGVNSSNHASKLSQKKFDGGHQYSVLFGS